MIENMDIVATKQTFKALDPVNAAATSQTISIHMPSRNGYIADIMVRVVTAFAGVTSPTLKIGISAADDCIMKAQSLEVVGRMKMGELPGYQFFCAGIDHVGSQDNFPVINAVFESASGNLSSLSAGEVEIVTVIVKDK